MIKAHVRRASVVIGVFVSIAITALVTKAGAAPDAAAPSGGVLPDAAYVQRRADEAFGSAFANVKATILPVTDEPGATQLRITTDSIERNASAPYFGLAQVGWRAHLLAGVVAKDAGSLVRASVSWEHMTSDEEKMMTFPLRGSVNGPVFPLEKSGSVPQDAAIRQLSASAETLDASLAKDAGFEATIEPVPVDADRSLFGLLIKVHVRSLKDLTGRVHDVEDGLQTGLVGSDQGVIEGLAIELTDDSGTQAGWWSDGRTGVGFGLPGQLSDDGLQLPALDFRNLTGGPARSMSVHAGTLAVPQPLPLKVGSALGGVKLTDTRRTLRKRYKHTTQDGSAETYVADGHKLHVTFSRAGRALGIVGSASRVIIAGHTYFARAQAAKALAKRGWTVSSCPPDTFMTAVSGRKSSQLQWRGRELSRAGVFSQDGGLGGCPVASSP